MWGIMTGAGRGTSEEEQPVKPSETLWEPPENTTESLVRELVTFSPVLYMVKKNALCSLRVSMF